MKLIRDIIQTYFQASVNSSTFASREWQSLSGSCQEEGSSTPRKWQTQFPLVRKFVGSPFLFMNYSLCSLLWWLSFSLAILSQGCHMVRKSGKTKKNDKSQVKIGVFKKSQEKILKNIRFTKFLIFKSLPLVKN